MASPATKNLHVPLPEALYRRLRAEAQRTRRPATEIARHAIERWLSEQHRAAIHAAIVRYAQATAGSAEDLAPELEAASVERLRDQEDR